MWVHATLDSWYQWLLLVALAEVDGKTISGIVREAVRDYINRRLGDGDKCLYCMLEEKPLECMVKCVSEATRKAE